MSGNIRHATLKTSVGVSSERRREEPDALRLSAWIESGLNPETPDPWDKMTQEQERLVGNAAKVAGRLKRQNGRVTDDGQAEGGTTMGVKALVIGLLMLAPAAGAYAAGEAKPGELRHSGTIVDVGRDTRQFTMEEMLAWTGPGTGVVERTVILTPRTSIQLVTRFEDPDRPSLTGFKESPLAPSDLRPGDFVTVTTDRREGPLMAVSMEVVRPEANR
jgi:hypothetical protein